MDIAAAASHEIFLRIDRPSSVAPDVQASRGLACRT
jgi:hypothetical protein